MYQQLGKDKSPSQIKDQQVAANYSFQNIAKILRQNQQKPQISSLEQRYQRIVAQREKLAQLVDMDKMVGIQIAVQERMGPQMCDNSNEERSKMKNRFFAVLKDYKQKISREINNQKRMVANAKEKCNLMIAQLEKQIIAATKDQDKRIQAQKQKFKVHKMKTLEQIRNLKQSQQIAKLEAQLYAFQSQMEMKLLQINVLSRKRMQNINSKIQSFKSFKRSLLP